jgi:hypothetical protein
METLMTKSARRVAIDQQAQHHGGRVLGVACAALVGARTAQVQRFDRIHNEVDHVVLRNPIAQVGREKQWGVVVNVDETDGHFLHTRLRAQLFSESDF